MFVHTPSEIGNRLLTLRLAGGLTQAELAEKAGLSTRTYADIERGDSGTRLESILRICEALNVTPNDIVQQEHLRDVYRDEDLVTVLAAISPHEKTALLRRLKAYLNSVAEL